MKKSLFLLLGALMCGCAKTNLMPPRSFYNQLKQYASPFQKNISGLEAEMDGVPIRIYLQSRPNHSIRIIGEMAVADIFETRFMNRGKNSLYWEFKESNTYVYVFDMDGDGRVKNTEQAFYSMMGVSEFFSYLTKALSDSEIISNRLTDEEYQKLQREILRFLHNERDKNKKGRSYDRYWIECYNHDNESTLKTNLNLR